MRHTDALLGHKPHDVDAMQQLERETLQRQRRVDHENLKALQELLQCPGWQVFKDYCQREHQAIMAKLEQCHDPVTLAKLVGVNLAVESFPTWPERQAEELVAAIEQADALEKESP